MEAAIFDDLTALADVTRSRMLLVLERHELTVSELCVVLQLPQSTVSRHLKTLLDAEWVSSRRDGTSRYYTLALDDRGTATRKLWALLREQVSLTPGADQDGRRLRGVLSERQSKSQEFFASSAGQWDRLRDDLFGRASYLLALPGLLDPDWLVGDLGCGTGQVTAALAPFVAQVIAVDRSNDMLAEARERVRDLANVDLRRGELEIYRQQMGHVWLGFSEEALRRMLTQAGFDRIKVVAMPVTTEAKGPALFVASATKAMLNVECCMLK